MTNTTEAPVLDPILKLTRDVRNSAKLLTSDQARYLVDCYYQLQDFRIASASQVRNQKEEPTEINTWLSNQLESLETQIKGALQKYAEAQVAGRWALSITGIGPVLAAGLLAHCQGYNSVSGLWRFAGQDPTAEWLGQSGAQFVVQEVMGEDKKLTYDHLIAIGMKVNKAPAAIKAAALKLADKPEGTELNKAMVVKALSRRPWNAKLKVLAWKCGESFVKVCNNEKDIYGKLYKERKALEEARNERGEYAQAAAEKLLKVKIGKETDAYKAYSIGKLPPAHIHARAKRYAVKMFLSHFAQVKYESEHNKPIPQPWIIAHGGHKDFVPPPNYPIPNFPAV